MSVSARPARRRSLAAVAVLALAGSALLVPTASTAAPPPPPAPVAWGPCAPAAIANVPVAEQFKFSCALHPVPLDHDDPSLGTIDIALMRRAADAAGGPRIGSLFLNPGGPGASGYRYPTVGGAIFEPEVMDRFDLIGFDPRGVARSTPLRCFETDEEADEVFARMAALPVTPDEEAATLDAYADYSASCAEVAGPLLQHMSTKDVARDLDLLRAAVGDRRLTFVGFSYGTLLGATYANMFPAKVRALVLDGNVDPRLRLHDGLEYDRQRTRGFEISLNAFLARCDAAASCAFAPDARDKLTDLLEHLRAEGPVTLPDGTVVDEATVVDVTAGTLYDPVRWRTWSVPAGGAPGRLPGARRPACGPGPRRRRRPARTSRAGAARRPAGHPVQLGRLLRGGELLGQAVHPPPAAGAGDRGPVGAADARLRSVPGVGRPRDLPDLAGGVPGHLRGAVAGGRPTRCWSSATTTTPRRSTGSPSGWRASSATRGCSASTRSGTASSAAASAPTASRPAT